MLASATEKARPPGDLPYVKTCPKNPPNKVCGGTLITKCDILKVFSQCELPQPPSLNTLPLFEKFDKLEIAQQEMKGKATFQN